MEYRIYLIREHGKEDLRLVRAGSPAQIYRHLIRGRFEIEKPSTADVADYIQAGIPVERVANNDNADAV
jgi:hypothetical protein